MALLKRERVARPVFTLVVRSQLSNSRGMTVVAAVHKAAPKVKKTPASHPPYVDMVKHAVKELKERNGSSRQAISKYVKGHYKVDAKADHCLKRALVSAVKTGKLVHTKGTGASGSFKIAEKATTKPKVVKKPKTPKKAATKAHKTPKPASAKKVKTPKAAKPKKVKTPKKPKTLKPKKPVAKKTPKKVVKKVAK